ncbi:MAG: hypothetical protein IJ633_08860 [Prevotella sp.]|nr:hypothetical protein [Prevotella sp.]
MKLYTINHGKGYTRTSDSYRSNLGIVNKETLLHVAKRLGVEGVAKSHSKEKMTEVISAFVLSHPEECLQHFSVKELLLLKDFSEKGADTSIVRPNRKYYNTLRELLFVSTYHSKKERSLYFILPDELRELFAPLLDKHIKEAKKRERAEKEAKPSAPVINLGAPALSDEDFDDDWDEDEPEYQEEIIGIGHRHFDNLYEFFNSIPDHDFFDSVLAVQDFHQNANVVESRSGIITLYASVVYANQRTENVIYRSKEPIEVRIDTEDLNAVTIPGLPATCVSKFSTEKEEMNYSYGVLTIEGHDKSGEPFIVSLI